MRLSSLFNPSILLGFLSFIVGVIADDNYLAASSLVTCMDKSLFSASQFDVKFFPKNRTVQYSIVATSEISGKITAIADIYAYGFKILTETIDLCSLNLAQVCPISPGQIDLTSTAEINESIVKDIPNIAYTFPDLDAIAIVNIYTSDGTKVACLQATFDNGKTVDHVYVKWITAVIAGIGLLTSAITSAFGHSNTAAHIAANSVSLFTYFQTTVIFTMEAVARLPPIASAWGQNLAWSMGLIEVPFMQKIFRWFVQSTGGTPTTYLSFKTISILLQKRFLSSSDIQKLTEISASLSKRDSIYEPSSTSTLLVLRGILRVAYEANIEQTSVVLTGITIFFFFSIALGIALVLVLLFLILLIKTNLVKSDRFLYFRSNWLLILKGILLRIVLIGFPQLLILSFWEFVERDSAAVIVIAVFVIIMILSVLGWACYKVAAIARRSVREFKTPSYLLFADQTNLNRYGFLYIQYNAQHYYFVTVYFGYVFIKSCFISFGQSSGKTQALAIFIFELAFFIMLCVIKPFMDKRTNVLNIIIGLVNTINAFMFMFFSQLFGQPAAVASVMGVIFFVLNCIFSLVLIIMTLATCTMALLSKNPDNKYHPSKDDRDSFIKSAGGAGNSKNDLVELTALGAAAQADHDEEEWRDSIAVANLDENVYPYSKSSNSSSSLSNRTDPYGGFGSGVVQTSPRHPVGYTGNDNGLNDTSRGLASSVDPTGSSNSLISSGFDNDRRTRDASTNGDFEFYNHSENSSSIFNQELISHNDNAAFIPRRN